MAKSKVTISVKSLTSAIKKDKDLYFGYQSNIAMAFVDEYERCKKKYKNKSDIRRIANAAAKNFLNAWIRD